MLIPKEWKRIKNKSGNGFFPRLPLSVRESGGIKAAA
jgi:hypothetical protein